ncbi:class A beta-lactamase-related serine hydrolase [Chryseobacterium nematophagum]|uniref:Class A beta-lactamase-related serine hydrolase n=1 Tax=Chryseobacterium nematophagum TaxID=2305228 RepID=A0A3M7LGF2_9FLAO|nr:serine hydrolase domain-containing protein [Chryseobacterium nematophagum]RMZ61160.1 class A beta-lactamase-related serine hydrolase [Chryseobacterium nematophagum]
MKTNKLFLIPLLFGILGCSNDENNKNYQAELDGVVKNIHANLQNSLQTDIPSLSVYVVSTKGTYFSTIKGTNGTTVTPNTYFRFASNTKSFTSTAILKMMQDGWLNLDDKITANIPGTDIPYTPNIAEWNFPFKNQITIRQLLQHNAGVYDVTNDNSQYHINGETYGDYMLNNYPDHQFATTEYIKVLTEHNLTYGAPNTVYHYSNTGYSILGEIIARIYSQKANTPKTYGNYMYDHIVGPSSKVPIGIRFPELASDKQLLTPYVKGLIKNDNTMEVTDLKNASPHIAEGNGVGTMLMLSSYIRSVMKGKNVLYPSSAELMRKSRGLATTVENRNYSLGCFYLPGVGYGHNGATEGYLSIMLYDPDTDFSVIVLLPFWDLSNNAQKFPQCINALNMTALEAKKTLGY